MRTIKASAPTKAIIAGEHSVVYGGSAIAMPLENRKSCVCKIREASGGLGLIKVDDSIGTGKYFADGTFEDADGFFKAKAQLIGFILKSSGKGISGQDISLSLSKNKMPKGTGHSAATAAAIALCLYSGLGVAPSRSRLFEAIQVFEEVAHGGRPSGVDANAVISDSPQKFRREFPQGGGSKFDFESIALALPKGTALLVVNTLTKGGTFQTTDELIAKFGQSLGISRKPGELGEEERAQIIAPFDSIVEQIQGELHEGGDPEKLGKLLNANHDLLRRCGVSSEGIENAIGISLRNGALGAKLTGAGGRGGAVIVFCREGMAAKILLALGKAGMAGIRAKISSRGACLEK